jgi:hypothetical protein
MERNPNLDKPRWTARRCRVSGRVLLAAAVSHADREEPTLNFYRSSIVRTIVDDRLYNHGIGLSNKVYRRHLFNIGLTHAIGANGYAVYGYYTEQQSLTPLITRPTKSVGINFNYTRDVRLDVRGYGSIGYADTINSPATVFTTWTTNFNTITAAVGVNYLPS